MHAPVLPVTMPAMKVTGQRLAYLLFSHVLASIPACVVLIAVLLPFVGLWDVLAMCSQPMHSGSWAWLTIPLVLLTKGCTQLDGWPHNLYVLGSLALAWIIYVKALVLTYRTLHQLDEKERREQQEHLLVKGLCPTCQYNLTGNTSGTCPECGTPTPGSKEP